jgi:hypothetical protein
VTDLGVRWAVSIVSFAYSYIVGTFYFMYLQKIINLSKAVEKLVSAFEKDVANLLRSPGDLSLLEQGQKTLILVEAINLVKNLLIRTFVIGHPC